MRLGAIAGHNGEALRGVDLKMTRRAGTDPHLHVQFQDRPRHRAVGRPARRRARHAKSCYFETDDAGALFRFTDNYARMQGGQMWVAIDPPTPDQQPQDGVSEHPRFFHQGRAEPRSRGRAARRRRRELISHACAWNSPARPAGSPSVKALVRGPTIGATIDGNIDFAKKRRAHARHLRAALRLEQRLRPDSDRRIIPRRQQRRLARHHV